MKSEPGMKRCGTARSRKSRFGAMWLGRRAEASDVGRQKREKEAGNGKSEKRGGGRNRTIRGCSV